VLDMNTFLTLVFIGVTIVVIGVLLIFIAGISSQGESRVEGGGVVVIGPIPIVFGSSQRITIILLVLAIILTIATIVLYIMLGRGIY